MRIGFFSDRYLPLTDGIAYSIESFRTELEALGHEVYVFAPKPSLRYKDPSDHIIRFPAVKGLFFEDYLTSFFFPPQVIKQIERLKLDVIHFHTPGQIGLFGAYFAIRHEIPLVTTYHTDLYEYVKHYPSVLPGTIALSMLAPVITGGGMSEYREGLSSIRPERSIDKWNQKIVERGVTMIHNHCDVVITPSRKISNQLINWKTQSEITVLPTGVDKITTNTREINRLRADFNLQPSDKIVLFVGRIGTEKNIGLLIDAFNHIGARDPHAKLVIAGSGDDLDHFKEQAAHNTYFDRIIFTGRIEQRSRLGALYSISSVFAFPSVADTQGLVVNEAARAGLPLVMVDRGVSEVLVPKENGYYAKNQPKDFAHKILAILANEKLHTSMSHRSVELSAEFSASQQAAKLLRLYQNTIEHHREANAVKTRRQRLRNS